MILVSLVCLDRGLLAAGRRVVRREGGKVTLPDIHAALRTLLTEEGLINPAEVDVAFDAPTRQWVDRLTRPTINLFLHDVRENAERRDNSYHVARKDGRAERRRAPRRIDLRYLVSAIATDVDDEHRLLWRALYALMKHQSLPDRVMPEALRRLDPPLFAQTAQADEGTARQDLWSALGVEPRAAFAYVLTAPLDLDLVVTAPLVLTRTLRVQRLANGHVAPEVASEGGTRIGGVVRDRAGLAVAAATVTLEGHADGGVTDAEGRFVLARIPDGDVRVRVVLPDGGTQTVTLHVPSAAYEITLR